MKNLFVVAALTALTAGTAYADCSFPPAPEKIPDGRTATRQEMIDAQLALKAYDKAINAYTACLDQDHDSRLVNAGDTLTEEQKRRLDRMTIERHNAAIDMLHSVVDRFNEQLRIFNGRDKKS